MSSASRSKGKGKAIDGRYTTDVRKVCPNCGASFAVRGFASHFRKCNEQRKYEEVIAARKRALELNAEEPHTSRKRTANYEVLRTPKRGRLIRQGDPSSSRLSSPDVGSPVVVDEEIFGPLTGTPHPAHMTSTVEHELQAEIANATGLDVDAVAPPSASEPQEHGQAASAGGEPDNELSEAEEDDAQQAAPPLLVDKAGDLIDNQNFMPEEGHPVTNPVAINNPQAVPTTDNDAQAVPMANDIRVEYRRAAGLPPRIFAFHDFRQEKRTLDIVVSKSNLWKPFKTRLDFELAEFTQKASLNKQLINSLFKLVKDIVSRPTDLTLESADDVNCVWESATLYHPSFTSMSISQPYKGEDKVFDFYSRPLWEWVLSQVQDPLLAPYMEWDAQQLSKFDSTKWVCFYDEPWTARKFAEVQSDISRVRSGGKPLAIILWADTSVLSTFGTQKGHYIVARVGNLPMWIQNGRSFGGGRIVGFLPIGMVGEQKKPGFVNWKNAVFRVLFPYIHILSADYEEQCHFALIRGLNGLAPCPVCLVPKGTLSDLRTRYQYRSAVENEVLVRLTAPSAEKEYELKSRGLRNVENTLWAVANTDVHQALLYDRLHVDIIGMFQKHILPEIKTKLKHLGRRAQVEFDETYMNMAHWSDLAHFKHGILTLDFSDGKKWADVARILIHAARNVMSEAKSPKGFALLKVFRKWHDLNMYLSFEVHTEETIPAYDRTLNTFHDRLAEYIDLNKGDDLTDVKDWNRIIKLHVHVHAA
ncbi:hypothetical protein BC835DRAFT_1420080 [Cytidiella melzeri]|nr:hypothetical protein BC835DRAFT_1420080 [Cytidiella melzeri]